MMILTPKRIILISLFWISYQTGWTQEFTSDMHQAPNNALYQNFNKGIDESESKILLKPLAVNSAADEFSMNFMEDRLYFVSNRSRHNGIDKLKSSYDIYMADFTNIDSLTSL